MQKTLLVLALVAAVALGMGDRAVRAAEKDAPPTVAELEKMSGKDLYKHTCKPCHAAKSPAGEYTPMTLIQEQWETFFDKKLVAAHKSLADTTAVKPADQWMTPEMRGRLQTITPKMLEKIRKFTIDGAADSEHPMTCG